MSFDASFDSSFDADGAGSGNVFYGTPTAQLLVQVVSPLAFSSAAGYIRWAVTATIGEVVLTQLTGELQITAGEDAARVATFSVIPVSPAQLYSFESSPVALDLTLFRTGQTATIRRFTGVVETVEFNPVSRVATLHCRDGYQERAKACKTAAEVESLFGGLACPNAKILPWDDEKPDPAGYFSRLQATMIGACAIDSSGLWRSVSWSIGTPAASFPATEVFADSMQVMWANRRDMPSAIRATLNFRYARLHCAEVSITWTDPGPTEHLVLGLPVLSRSTIQQALSGLNGWLVKGKPIITGPTAGDHPVIVGGATQHYVIPYETAQTSCENLSATLYRRWYQQVQVSFSVDIPMGGASDREDSSAATLVSSFDARLWETTPTSEDSLGLYLTNPPVNPQPPTGYEGLPAPFPPGNSSIDHYPDVPEAELQAGARHVVSIALRKAAAGKRKQTVRFSRPLDPRWEIGDVLSVSAYGVAATGQLVDFEDHLDMDSGEAVSTLTLACPDGSGVATTLSATLIPPVSDVSHALLMAPVLTHKGGWVSTPSVPIEDNLVGFLCNVVLSADAADPNKPSYIAQFRLITPEIPANVRDPLVLEKPIVATVAIAGSGITVDF